MTIGTGIAFSAMWGSLGYMAIKLRQPEWVMYPLILAIFATFFASIL